MEFTLLWAALTGAAFTWIGLRIWSDGLPPKPFDVLIGAAVVGLLVGRLAAMVQQDVNPLTAPSQIILVRGGVDTGFATLGALAALAWMLRGRTTLADSLAPSALLGLAGWHAGCLWRSACLGTASELPWAWAQSGSSITRHPVEIYAALGLMAMAALIARLGPRPYLKTGLALAGAGVMRLATEPMRLTLTGGPVAWYTAAIVVGLSLALLGPSLPMRTEPVPT